MSSLSSAALRSPRWTLLLVVAAVAGLPAAASGIDIIDVHHNNSSGIPTMLGATTTVTGVVTAPPLVFDDYHLEVYVQDETAGIMVWVYAAAEDYAMALGDEVTVTSQVAQYNGMTELGTNTAYTTIVVHGPGAELPPPLPLTCAELNDTFQPDFSEPNEGRLIRLDDLTITGGTWPETPGGNAPIWVTDGTEEALVYIDQDTAVNGSPQPANGFSIVGVLKQFDTSAPYVTGYQLVPRYLTDVIPPGGADLPPGRVRNVTATTADVLFETLVPGSSEVEYGLSDAYGLVAGDPGAQQTNHQVTLTDLTANTIYHFRIKSQYDGGTSYGPDQLLATANDQAGEIHVMMSGSAETDYAGSQYEPVANGEVLSSRLAFLITQAESSVDAALYSFSLPNIRAALISAHNRGCLVRLIIDQNNSTEYAEDCAAVGIPYITSDYAGNHTSGIMHNKFVVIDGRDEDRHNDWTWTGSANMSYSGNDDINNALRINDYGLAQAYTREFNEMWGSDTQTPSDAARMGANKLDDTPHEFTIAGLRVEQYMSPTDGVTDKIIATAQTSQHSLYLAQLVFTHNSIANAMRDQRDATAGLQVAGVFDQNIGPCSEGSEYYSLSGDPCASGAWDPPADVWLDTALPTDQILHHKYLIVDVNHVSSDPQVLTGSHNWSYSADSVNDENTLILHDAEIANQFLQEFAARYHESGGSNDLGGLVAVPEGEVGPPARLVSGLQGYPNPFNPRTRVTFTTTAAARVTAAIYNARGERVVALTDSEVLAPGLHIYGWNGNDEYGRSLPSGVYFARVAAEPVAGGPAGGFAADNDPWTVTTPLTLVR